MNKPLALTLSLQGTQLIEASAGTGKTWTLALLLVRALVERDMRASQVLAITFTRAATAEIRQRVYTLLSKLDEALQNNASNDDDIAVSSFVAHLAQNNIAKALARARTRRALAEFDELSVFTIHGFYQRTLRDNALATGDLMDAGVQTQLMPDIQACTLDFWRRELVHHHTLSAHSDEATAQQLAQALLHYKRPGDKQAIFTTPAHMASWVKHLMQRAPQAQAGNITELQAQLALQIQQCVNELAIRQPLLQGLRETYSPHDIKAALIELQRIKRMPGTSYRKDFVGGWLSDIGAWLHSQSALHEAAPERLYTHFTTEAVQAAMKDQDALPASLQQFVQAVDAWCVSELAWQSQLRLLHLRLCACLVAQVTQALPARLAAQGLRSADGLALALIHALQADRGGALAASLRSRYSLVLVDEFQDTDATQWAVLQQVFHEGHTPLLLVGDPKQAIYRFRGADLGTYLRARAQAHATHALTINHRSTAALIDALNTLFAGQGAGGSFGDEGIRYVPITAARAEPSQADAFGVLSFEAAGSLQSQKQQAMQATVSRIQALLTHHKPHDIAVLVQSNEDIALVAQGLARAGIAAAATMRTQSIAQSFEALQLQWLMQALARPLDAALRQRVMLTPLWGQGVDSLYEAQRSDPQSDPLSDPHTDTQWQTQFIEWAALARSRGPAAALESVIRARGVVQRWLADDEPEAEERLARLRQVAEVVQHFNAQAATLDDACSFLQRWRHGAEQGNGDPSSYAFEKSLGLNLTDAMPRDDKIASARLASDRAAVTVMTVHGSKGLEFEAVILPFLWAGKEGREPSEILRDEGGMKRWDFGPQFSPQAIAQHETEEAGERQRVAYVALTRARNSCCVLWPALADDASAKAQTRVEVSALQALLGDRSWGNIHAGLEAYSPDKSTITHIKQGNIEYTGNSININPAQSMPAWPAVPPAWQAMSFSRWQRSSTLQVATEVVADRDETQSLPVASPGHSKLDLRYRFARGPQAGRALHSLLERLELGDTTSPKALSQIANWLILQGMSHEVTVADMQAWLHDIMQAKMQEGVRLHELAHAPQQREWEFHLPLQGADSTKLRHALLHAGAQSLREQPHTAPLPSGFFTGFVDAVFEHQGRYYVVDYKSNHLGDKAAQYAPTMLNAEVSKHQYDVQSVFYLLALHLHLMVRMQGYVPEQHLGGVSLLFLRGMHANSDTGVWTLPTNIPALHALARLLIKPRQV
jgi:exodeoxyribonuclease V beta subunit